MTCDKCVTIIQGAVGDMEGVSSVSVAREEGEAVGNNDMQDIMVMMQMAMPMLEL